MNLATILYKNYLESKGILRRLLGILRTITIRAFNDPTCHMSIHGKLLKLPLSHSCPDYLKQFPFYDSLPRRIGEYINTKYGKLYCVDVGANVGDSIAAFCPRETDSFLAIEPHPKFHKLLTENWSGNERIKISSEVCSSESYEGKFLINEKKGTASISKNETGTKLVSRPLDEIMKDYRLLIHNINVLKIDTDGHDFEVIAGAGKLIANNQPVVLFECDSFNNPDYFKQAISTLEFFKEKGYGHFLLYDNFGNLMGIYSLSELTPFKNLIFYQLTSTFYYFDILVMKDEDIFDFHKSEINFFMKDMPDGIY